MNAIADAVGEEVFRKAPVTADIVLMSLEHGKRMHDPLASHYKKNRRDRRDRREKFFFAFSAVSAVSSVRRHQPKI